MQNAIEIKFKKLQESLSEQQTFTMGDVEYIFQEYSKATLYWFVSELVKLGYVKRLRRGTFAFNEWMGKKNISISLEAEKLSGILSETGFNYYISGLDILAKYMHHVPEQYPIMLFAEKVGKDEIKTVLKENGFLVFEPTELKTRYEDAVYAGRDETQVVVYQTDNFEYENDGLATLEKAFVDTYFSVTRNDYPLALQELVRIYENMIRTGNIDLRKTITIASRRSIQYDIRYIVESRYITDEAQKFVEILKRGQ